MKPLLDSIIAQADQIILGKTNTLRLAFACILAKGHLLIEDLPGVGKTTLAHTFAHLLGLEFQRIQFTSDLLPSDILGVSIYDKNRAEFRFQAGPIFSQVIIADEINRATPKTQSALLEAMEENQVSVEGETRRLNQPFFVIATQNPNDQIGTFPLPESQLDRFLMRLAMGYPDQEAERALLMGQSRRQLLLETKACTEAKALLDIQQQVPQIHLSSALIDYVQALLKFTRDTHFYHTGLSPRAGLALVRCAQAWAILEGRQQVIPEDIQTVLPGIVSHRLQPTEQAPYHQADELAKHLLESVAIP